MSTLQEVLERNVREAAPELYEKLDRNRVRCCSCGHCCPIADGQVGVCKVRFNRGGTLYVPWGYVGGVQCDPIEKKPFFHACTRNVTFRGKALADCRGAPPARVVARMACDLARSATFGLVEVHGKQPNPLDRMWRAAQLAETLTALSR